MDIILFMGLIYGAVLFTSAGTEFANYKISTLNVVGFFVIACLLSAVPNVYKLHEKLKFFKVFVCMASLISLAFILMPTMREAVAFFNVHIPDIRQGTILCAVIAWSIGIVFNRLLLSAALRSGFLVRPVVFIGERAEWSALSKDLCDSFHCKYRVTIRAVKDSEDHAVIEQLRRDKVWALVTATKNNQNISEPFEAFLMECCSYGIKIFRDVEFMERHFKRVDTSCLSPGWLAYKPNFSMTVFDAWVKRAFDVAFSLALLTLMCWVMVVTALLIKLESPGPILYRQKRVGYKGKEYSIYKFRSMRCDAESDGTAKWAVKNDPRITRVGSFIRRVRIDELPQLFNVLRGDMSIIGPRPERPNFVKLLTSEIPHYQDRNYVKPGITGWAQVSFPYGASVEDARMKLAYDLYYIKNRCVLFDLLIIAATVRVVLFQEGAR
jgi:exopolysaccharide biosynthesis polyprenyl glycosylphosphotransferase